MNREGNTSTSTLLTYLVALPNDGLSKQSSKAGDGKYAHRTCSRQSTQNSADQKTEHRMARY